jgi:hypothetical protein
VDVTAHQVLDTVVAEDLCGLWWPSTLGTFGTRTSSNGVAFSNL